MIVTINHQLFCLKSKLQFNKYIESPYTNLELIKSHLMTKIIYKLRQKY